ncbi:MAG: sugar phosphate isomerase [Planctomycetota bacterium]
MSASIPPTTTNPDRAAQQAEHYLVHDTAFRLGELPTEQPHPKTAGLSHTLIADTAAGIAALQSVDDDMPEVLRQTLAGEPFAKLLQTMTETLIAGRRVFFTGCGATGRLSILLEAMWRRVWNHADHPEAKTIADQVRSVMAGGDFALIRSVEGFEDFTDFGRHQLREAGVTQGDLVVAITEGGETSFVIGTAWEALDAGAASFFVYNNPSDVLAGLVERSREVLEEPRITKLDLATGPMAVAGSTRMQATTIELMVVGTALEHAIAAVQQAKGTASADALAPVALDETADRFAGLLSELAQPANRAAMAGLTEHEAEVYRASGLVTYFADRYLLDILTDTTERSPTFSLPPFREVGDDVSAKSWSFVKHPLLDTPGAWTDLLGRPPGGIDWDGPTYTAMNAPEAIREKPPVLNRQRILRFAIGNEPDPCRTEAPAALAVTLLVGHETQTHAAADSNFAQGVAQHTPAFGEHALLSIGSPPPAASPGDKQYIIEAELPDTPLDLWAHAAAKLVLNTISTASMGLVGRLAGNWMVYVNTSNKKLIDRGVRLIADQTGVPYDQACHELFITLNQPDADHLVGRRAASPVAVTIARINDANDDA